MLALVTATKHLMPAGVPAFNIIRERPTIAVLAKEMGEVDVAKVLYLMVKNFCDSFNVVRNMTVPQMVESASLLLDECGDFRIEDYHVMFTMAKRGGLIDIRDRIDVSMIGRLMDEYFKYRNEEGKKIQEREFSSADNSYNSKYVPPIAEDEAAASARFSEVVKRLTDHVRELNEEERKIAQQKEAEAAEKRRQQVEAYARRNGINWEEFDKQFGKKK